MRSRKRVISFVLGLVLILGSAVGPFAMGTMAETVNLSASVNPITNEENVTPGNISLSGTITGALAKTDKSSSVAITLTYKRQNQTDSTGADTITGTGTVTVSESGDSHTFTASATVNEADRGNSYRLDSISLSNAGDTDVTISGTSVFTVASTTPPAAEPPTITSITIDDKSSGISYPANHTGTVRIKAVISGSIECSVVAKIQSKQGEGFIELPEFSNIALSKQTGNGNEYAADIAIPTAAGEYVLFVEGKYKPAPELSDVDNLESKRIDFIITTSEGSNPTEPIIADATLGGLKNNIEFIKSTTQTSSVVVDFSDNTKTYTVTGKIMKKGDTDTYSEYIAGESASTVTITKSNGSTSYTGTMSVPGEAGNYRLDITAAYDTNKTLTKQILFTVKNGTPTGTLSFSEVKFTNYTEKSVSTVEESSLGISVKVTSTLQNDNVTVTANIDGVGIYNLSKGTDGTYTYSFVVPKYKVNSSDNYYGIAISASSPSSSSQTDKSLSYTVTQKPIDITLRLRCELSSNSLVGNSNGQIFTEGGTVKYAITSENPNVRFTNSTAAAWISANNGTPDTSVKLNKVTSGTYANRRYEGTFTAGVTLASNFYYTITNESFPYTVVGGSGGNSGIEPIAFTTASNKPYIRSGNLTAMYSSSAGSNIGVSQGSLIVGNVITYEAQLDNYSGVNSVNLEFINRSGMTGYNITIPLAKVNNTGLFRGSYTINTNNIGFTYDLNKITYKTSVGSTNYDMDNYPIYGHAFTVSYHQHTFGGNYQYNSEEHWQNSICNADHPGQIVIGNRGKHSFTNSIITPATQTTAGTRRYTCTICNYTYTATIPATGAALSTTTVNTIRNMANGTRAIIAFGSDYVVSSDVFNALKGTTKEVEFQSNNKVSWIFRGQDITGTIKAININTEISSAQSNTSPYASYIRKLIGSQPTVIIDFSANGNLPGRATVRVPLSTAMLNALRGNRTGLKVQYYNASTNRLEDVAKNVNVSDSGSNSFVEFAITHNSSYIITKEVSQSGNGNTNGTTNNSTNGNTNNSTSGNTNNTTNGNTGVNSGNKKPTTTTTTVINRVIHKVSPKTMDGGYGMLWVAMFMVGVLLVISSLCMTKFEE